MISYLGCKQSFAAELLSAMPDAENFYDLFGGGGSVTEAALRFHENGMFGEWRKWKKVHYNELNTGVYLLNKEIWSGRFDFEHAKAQEPTKERYYAERGNKTAWEAFVKFVWSFGTKGDCFMYNNNTRIMRRLEHLERLRRIAKSPKIGKEIKMTNKDYRKVKIKPNSVAYCDIPYNVNKNYYGVKFDFEAFYNWAATRKFPVYFSDYDCKDSRFELVWQSLITPKINNSGNGKYRTEKLFWNGVKPQEAK